MYFALGGVARRDEKRGQSCLLSILQSEKRLNLSESRLIPFLAREISFFCGHMSLHCKVLQNECLIRDPSILNSLNQSDVY